jgi:hypothetical protein
MVINTNKRITKRNYRAEKKKNGLITLNDTAKQFVKEIQIKLGIEDIKVSRKYNSLFLISEGSKFVIIMNCKHNNFVCFKDYYPEYRIINFKLREHTKDNLFQMLDGFKMIKAPKVILKRNYEEKEEASS